MHHQVQKFLVGAIPSVLGAQIFIDGSSANVRVREIMGCLTEKRAVARLLDLAFHKTADKKTHVRNEANVAIGATIDLDIEGPLDDIGNGLEYLGTFHHETHIAAQRFRAALVETLCVHDMQCN